MRQSIYFFKVGSNSLKNPAIARMLREGFPEADLVVVDVVQDLVMKSPRTLCAALIEAARRYPYELFRLRHDPRSYFPRLPSVHRCLQSFIRQKVRPEECLFILQNQSLFDASHPGIPFFLYTDHTYRANYRYPKHRFFRSGPSDWDAIESRFYAHARLCFTTCEFTRRSLIEDYQIPPEKVVCIQTGANTPTPPTVPLHEFGGRIIFVGIDWERKGGPDLVAAFTLLRAKYPTAQLVVVGCRPQLPISGCTELGKLSSAEISARMLEADVFCMPSYWDTSPMALAEAALHGLPAVSTTVGGIPDRVIDGETGYLVPPGNVEAIAAALEKLFSDPDLRRRMGQRAYDHAKSQFTWEAVSKKLHTSIREALAAGFAASPQRLSVAL